jgi:hypothetical protein
MRTESCLVMANVYRAAPACARLRSPNPEAAMEEDEEIQLDPVATVARITALEILVRQMMIIQLRILHEMKQIDLTPAYVETLAGLYTEKVDESKIIDSSSPEVNYEFKVNVIHNLERFFDEIADHLRANP